MPQQPIPHFDAPEALAAFHPSIQPIEHVGQLGRLIAVRWDGKPCTEAERGCAELSLAITTETQVFPGETPNQPPHRTYRAVGLVTGRLIEFPAGHTVFAFPPQARICLQAR